ncbi:MAG: dihydroneopterin aldolase, partial [Lachnospiraceae bacterium]|nr:dihydroneopterin aldolase [Lachnospiraceae bacterium]
MKMLKLSDFIKITNLKIFAYHGVLEEEKQIGQDFYINAKLYLDLKSAGKSDNLEDALNYAEV